MADDFTDVQTKDQRAEDLKAIGWVSYLLHLIVAVGAVIPGAQPGAALLLIALVIDLVKKSDAEGTWQASHFSWRLRTVIWAGVLYVLTAPLWILILPGWIAWGLISLWFLYRIVRGMVAMNKGQALEMMRLALLCLSRCLAQPLADSPSSAEQTRRTPCISLTMRKLAQSHSGLGNQLSGGCGRFHSSLHHARSELPFLQDHCRRDSFPQGL